MKLYRFISAITLLAVVFSLFGCSGNGKGAQLYSPLPYEPQCLDPQVAFGESERNIIANCYEGLYKLDGTGAPVLAAADECTVSADGLVYTFKLREGLKWHLNTNHAAVLGEEYEKTFNNSLTAADFVFALRRAVLPDTHSADAQLLFSIKNAQDIYEKKANPTTLGVSAADASTLVITLDTPCAALPEILAKPVAMPCSEGFFVACNGKYGLSAEYVLCNGSFYLSRWYQGTSIVLRQNPDNEKNMAYPFSVTYGFTTDSSLILERLTNDGYDAAPIDQSVLEAAKSGGCKITQLDNITWGLLFNCKVDELDNQKLRSAMCRATDYKIFNDEQLGERAYWVVPPCCVVNGVPFSDNSGGIPSNTFSAAAAVSGFSEALAELDKDKVEVSVLCVSEHETITRRLIQIWQKTLGIKMMAKIEICKSVDELTSRVDSGDFQVALAPIKSQYSSAVDFLRIFTSTSPLNPASYSSESYDSLIRKLETVSATADILEGCRRAQTMLIQSNVFYPVFSQSSYFAAAKGVSGVTVMPAGEYIDFSKVLK